MITASRWTRSRWMWLRASVAALVSAAAVVLLAPAADHRDGPIFPMTGNGNLDLNDLYVFKPNAASTNTVLILTVNPFAGVFSPTTFNQTLAFDFKVDNNGDAVEDLTFRVTFSAPDAQGVQQVTLRGLPALRFPATGGILARGNTGQTLPVRGGGLFRAANHDDPFFFDATAFNRFLRTGNPGEFGPPNTARNFFGPNVNTLAIILEVPSALITRPGNPNIGVWIRCERNGVQIDRMGRPAINTALIPPIPRGMGITPGPERRNAFNAGHPQNDRRDFSADMIGVLRNFYGRTQADAQGLTNVLLPDILTFDTSSTAGFLNGRRLEDDVIDAEISILANITGASDRVGNDSTFLTTFPYLAAPNNPPAGLNNMFP